MQPYFLPYIGYFQLIAAADVFIIYDNIKYTKRGWINRNRMLKNGKDVMFSLPLKSESDSKNIGQRELSGEFSRNKLLNQFKNVYRRAPYFELTFPLIEEIVRHRDENLFCYLHHSIVKICEHLGIRTEVRISSDMIINHELKSQDKVLALCEAAGASIYVNNISGMELYSKEGFREKGIELKYLSSNLFKYMQSGPDFVPYLSIVDVLMFNSTEAIQNCISTNYELL